MAQHREPASLVIAEAKCAAPDLSAEGAVLFEQIGDGVRFVLVEPRGEGDIKKAHGRRVKHAGQHSPERLAFEGRPINGTLRASILLGFLSAARCYVRRRLESYRICRRAYFLRGCSPWHDRVDIPPRYESGPFGWSASTEPSTRLSGPRSRRSRASWAARPKRCGSECGRPSAMRACAAA